MNKTKFTLSVLATFLFIITCATAGQAVPRTFVSGSGSDANTATNCSFSAPCRFLSAAYGVTDTGGEIIALTPSGFGGLNITKAITVQSVPGNWGFISVVPSSAGITVAAGAAENVVIRNFQFTGAPALGAGSIGINHTSGLLKVENCTFTALSLGFSTTKKADMIDSDFSGNTTALKADGSGSITNGTTGSAPTTLIRMAGGNVNNNGTAFHQANPGYNPCGGGPFSCNCTGDFSAPNQSARSNIIMFQDGSFGFRTNVTGNTVAVTGSGASCTSGPACTCSTGPACLNGATIPNICGNLAVYGTLNNP